MATSVTSSSPLCGYICCLLAVFTPFRWEGPGLLTSVHIFLEHPVLLGSATGRKCFVRTFSVPFRNEWIVQNPEVVLTNSVLESSVDNEILENLKTWTLFGLTRLCHRPFRGASVLYIFDWAGSFEFILFAWLPFDNEISGNLLFLLGRSYGYTVLESAAYQADEERMLTSFTRVMVACVSSNSTPTTQ